MYGLVIAVFAQLATHSLAAPQMSGSLSLLSELESIVPTATPSSVAQVSSVLSSIYAAQTNDPNEVFDMAVSMVKNGILSGSLTIAVSEVELALGNNSMSNNNNPPPKKVIYPQASSSDPPYDVSEASLRGAIVIPPGFTYGQKPPVILFPGTGSTGYDSYVGNYIPLLSNVDYADPVWVNVPGFLLGDAQVNAEYAAYAINYIASVTSRNVSVIAWSQGNLDTQWALKYWNSTRSLVSDFISISADFHGSLLTVLTCGPPPLNGGCTPSIYQQGYNSEFVTRLRMDGGDSAYVPTTSIYSATDEIVEPQSGPNASAIIQDARGVGVSNTEVQLACPGLPAGGVWTHEGMLANSLAFALAKDALQNPGPGQLSRIDLAEACSGIIAPGLTLGDFLLTETTIPVAVVVILEYEPKSTSEPPIKSYALAYK